MLRLRLIDPVTPSLLPQETVEQLAAPLRGRADLDCIGIAKGPASIETEADEQRALPGTLQRVREAEEGGYNAVVVGCVGDVGVEEARRAVSIPVIGPGEGAIRLAQTWGARYSILIASPQGEASMIERKTHLKRLLETLSEIDIEAREQLIQGYEVFREFDRAALALCEPLRALRIIHMSGWIAKRWDDPSFPAAFPAFRTDNYWLAEYEALFNIADAL